MSYILEAKSVQISPIRILAEGIKSMIVEMSLICDKNGIRMIAMDKKSKIILIHLELFANKFEKFEYNHSSPKFILGVNTDHFYKIVKTASNSDTITFFVSQSDLNTLGILLEDGNIKQMTQYKLNLIDRDEPDLPFPDSTFPFRITMPSADLQKICRDMTLLDARIVEIKNVNSTLSFSCKGHFASCTTTIGDNANEFGIENEKKDEIISGMFSIPFLTLFTKCTNLCNNIEIYMKNDWFLMIKYTVAELGEIKLCLMPAVV